MKRCLDATLVLDGLKRVEKSEREAKRIGSVCRRSHSTDLSNFLSRAWQKAREGLSWAA